MSETVFFLLPIVFLAYATEATLGFGAMLITITLGSLVLSIESLVPVAVPFSIVISLYISGRYWRLIDGGLLLKQVLPFMLSGIFIGLIVYPIIQGAYLKRIFGLIVTAYAARELYFSLPKNTAKQRRLSKLQSAFWLILAGVTHAIYATGGPMLVYVVGRIGLNKSVFRATLCTIWAVLNTFLTVTFIANGRIDKTSLTMTAILLPALFLGIFAGEWIHSRISEQRFRRIVFTVLLIVGLKLVVS